MTLVGKLGTSSSWLSNIELAYTISPVDVTATLTGGSSSTGILSLISSIKYVDASLVASSSLSAPRLRSLLRATLSGSSTLSPLVTVGFSESLSQSVTLSVVSSLSVQIDETLSLVERVIASSLKFTSLTPTSIEIDFPCYAEVDQLALKNFSVSPKSSSVEVVVRSVTPVQELVQQGSKGQVSPSGTGDFKSFKSFTFDTFDGSFVDTYIGDYLYLEDSETNFSYPCKILSCSGSQVTVDKSLSFSGLDNGTYQVPASPWDPGSFLAGTGSISWTHKKPPSGVLLDVSETPLGGTYIGQVIDLVTSSGTLYSASGEFVTLGVKPTLVGSQFLVEEGSVLLTFDKDLKVNNLLLETSTYVISGPTSVVVFDSVSVDSKTVLLKTRGFGVGTYTVTVGSVEDLLGNTLDPAHNSSTFTGSIPIANRTIYTDKGPISKPELTLQSGVGASIRTSTSPHFGAITLREVLFPSGSFNLTHVGKYLELGGTSINGGTYLVLEVVSSIRLILQASFHLPDPSNGSLTWRLFDPRTGEIANDPSDVVVRINSHVVAVQEVVGLLNKIVLDTPPAHGSDVKVEYSWIPEPTVVLQRLNSKEFKLNGWNLDSRSCLRPHLARYRNVLITPASYEPDSLLSEQKQPILRDLHYRAFERGYSIALNNPSLFRLNTPSHKVAYPTLSREVSEVSVGYNATDTLPENDPTYPWTYRGSGTAILSNGTLVVEDNTSGPYPEGNPIFWTRSVDTTYPSVSAATWRMVIDTVTPVGVFTGVAVGWSDDKRVALLGYLLDGGIRKIGFLKKGSGNQASLISSWGGGLDLNGDPTGAPMVFDWSVLHSYRFLRSSTGTMKFYVDGEIVESLLALEDDLPFLAELNDPFDQIQNIFFGSLSREALNKSTWDFVRYLVLPTNPEQNARSILVSYEGVDLPENNLKAWTPIGYHGNESLLSGSLILDSTSATDAVGVGLIGGDFRGFTRIEPLLETSSDVEVEFGVTLRTYTHGTSSNSVMVAVDDGDRLVQLSFFPSKSQPKLSYPGRSLPTEASPNPWISLGTSSAEMVGRILRISDTQTNTGRVFAIADLEPAGSDSRILSFDLDWYAEFKCQVISYTGDGHTDNFCGASVDIFDGYRTLGLMLSKDSGSGDLQVSFHSDGQIRPGVASFDFNWFDNNSHVYRIVKSTSGNLVSLFVDNVFVGSYAYSGFELATGDPVYSFGSSTVSSSGSLSVVDWHYANLWRAQPSAGVNHYLGIWKGLEDSSLIGYHLPLKVSGSANTVGNVVTCTEVDFVSLGVTSGDPFVVDYGINKGVFQIDSVSQNVLTILGSFPQTGETVTDFRIPSQVSWEVPHTYKLIRNPSGFVELYEDSGVTPLLRIDYSSSTLPSSVVGVPHLLADGLPSVTWGSFDSLNLTQTAWDFVRYSITKYPTGDKIVPDHQVLNQRNIMSSAEHLYGKVAHSHTQYSSCSTGVPTPWEQYSSLAGVRAFTQLNEGVPLVPSTQTYEVRKPNPFSVPSDILYNKLQVLEEVEGSSQSVISPASDEVGLSNMSLSFSGDVVGTYAGVVLPEQDSNFGTPWALGSGVPSQVTTSVAGGELTYSVGPLGTTTIYRNLTPLTNEAGFTTTLEFRLKLVTDSSIWSGDSGVRFGFSAWGLTAALAFVSMASGEREVQLLDLNSNEVLGAISFDYLDQAYHTYQLVRNVEEGCLDFLIDP